MAADSPAVFQARATALGLQEFLAALTTKGWGTLGEFAFAVNFAPGPTDATTFDTIVVEPITGHKNHAKTAALRRLFFEAYTTVAADIQRRLESGPGESKPTVLNNIERADRTDKLRALHPDLDFSDEWEPSWTLISKFHTMAESGNFKHVPWKLLTRQDLEVCGAKEDDYWQVDAAGYLKVSSKPAEQEAAVGTDLLLLQALGRRGAALHIARLLSFKIHAAYVKDIMKEYTREPIPGYDRVSLEQVLAADREVFCKVAETTKGNLAPNIDGTFPLDVAFPAAYAEKRIAAILFQPRLPGNSRVAAPKRQADFPAPAQHSQQKRARKGNGRGKGEKGSGKQKGNRNAPLPKELVDLGCKQPPDGRRLCYGFNTSKGCSNGNACSLGEHACFKCGRKGHGAASRSC